MTLNTDIFGFKLWKTKPSPLPENKNQKQNTPQHILSSMVATQY